jgi:hypothetical protein
MATTILAADLGRFNISSASSSTAVAAVASRFDLLVSQSFLTVPSASHVLG